MDKVDVRLLSVQRHGKPIVGTSPIDGIANLFSMVSIDSLLLERNRPMLKKSSLWCGVVASLLLIAGATPSNAGVMNFKADWSGASRGNSAQATAFLSFDPSLLTNPGINPFMTVDALTITVTGASAGNGTFILADFSHVRLDTHGGTLDFSRQLVGQSTSGATWGTIGTPSGDFSLFHECAIGT